MNPNIHTVETVVGWTVQSVWDLSRSRVEWLRHRWFWRQRPLIHHKVRSCFRMLCTFDQPSALAPEVVLLNSWRRNFTSQVRYSMARCIHAGLLPNSNCFGFGSVGLLDFGALFFPAVWLGSKVGFLELLAFAIYMRWGTGVEAKRDWCRSEEGEACNKIYFFTIMIIYSKCWWQTRSLTGQKPRGKKRPKSDAKAALELLSHLKKQSLIFWQPEIAGFKKHLKNWPKKPAKNRNVNHPNATQNW